tara:strand:+ start:458 stop:646 length:189 start_codon:yes stop_codon:yes gene_type:complete
LYFEISKTIREMVELLFLCTLSRGMKDYYFTTLFSLGEAWMKVRKPSFVHVFILTQYGKPVK